VYIDNYEINASIKIFDVFKYGNKFEEEYLRKVDEGIYNPDERELHKQLFLSTIHQLLILEPDKIGIELTNDDSIYFTLFKNEYIFFIEHYFNAEADDDDFFITQYQNQKKIKSFGGKIKSGINQLTTTNM